MKRIFLAIAVIMFSLSAFAGDIAAGKSKAATCMACYGGAGISPNDIWPNLAGQKEGYLVKQIKAFRDGDRVDPMMVPMVKPLSDTDVENLAAYFSGLN
ncbi:MAG: cytochrome c [Gammaproteobacteria bacterium]|nr:cytochrome c [Gammaproteobacteria bacterium]